MDKRKFNENEKKEFRKYADLHAPKSSTAKDCLFSFMCGGFICILGQAIHDLSLNFGISEENTKALVPVCLIFIACLLTGIGVFDKIASVAKAGTLVPITGFANAVCSSAIDAKSEGFILGTGSKMFVIAGPVIVYGTLASVVYGVIYWVMQML